MDPPGHRGEAPPRRSRPVSLPAGAGLEWAPGSGESSSKLRTLPIHAVEYSSSAMPPTTFFTLSATVLPSARSPSIREFRCRSFTLCGFDANRLSLDANFQRHPGARCLRDPRATPDPVCKVNMQRALVRDPFGFDMPSESVVGDEQRRAGGDSNQRRMPPCDPLGPIRWAMVRSAFRRRLAHRPSEAGTGSETCTSSADHSSGAGWPNRPQRAT